MIISVVAVSVLLPAGALATVHGLGIGQPGGTHSASGDRTSGAAAGRNDAFTATPADKVPAQLRPTPAVSHAPDSAPARRRATPSPTPTPVPASARCTNPQFVNSDPTGGWSDGRYYVTNDMWNIGSYSVTQTLYACAYNNWYVVANMNNNSGDGAVKTYPNVHEDFNEAPISSFHSISSTFAETSPHTGIYEDAYDIWINGLATPGSTEVMIWTENWNQVPSGSVQATVTFGGRTYKVWRNGSYIAFVGEANFTSGTLNLLAVFKWIIAQGWMPASSTLGQIDYGAELVSTNGAPATFTFTDFSVSAS